MEIRLSEFEDYVSPKIYARGEAYYEEGAVFRLEEKSPGEWVAGVHGSEDYRVEVDLEDGCLDYWECDCPYDGEFCKHVVAVLLEIREKEELKGCFLTADEAKAQGKTPSEVGRMLDLMDKEALMKFVEGYAASHPDFCEALKRHLLPEEKRADTYRKMTAGCFKPTEAWKRRYDESDIDWEETAYRMEACFDKAAFFIGQGAWQAAADIALQTFESVGENYVDVVYDQDGIVSDFCDEAAGLILDIVKKDAVPEKVKREIIRELQGFASWATYKEYGIFDLDSFVLKLRVETADDQTASELLEQWIAGHPDSPELGEFVVYRLEILHRAGCPDKVQALVRRYLYLPEVMEWGVEQFISRKEYDQAVALLDAGIEIVKQRDEEWLICDRMEKKIGIYRQTGNIPALIKTAKGLFISKNGDLKYYRLLKEYVPADSWKMFLEDLIQEVSKSYWGMQNLPLIYAEEQDYARLLDFLQQAKGNRLELLMQYAGYLKEWYSKEVLELFTEEVCRYAEQNIGRPHYEHVARVLKKMSGFKQGKAAVQALAEDFRIRYRRRPAMLEVLGRF